MPYIQDSQYNSAAVGLLSASTYNIFESNNLGPDGTWSGITNSALIIFLYSSLSFYPLKGKHPQKKANSKTPLAHMSAGGPQNSFFATISGAMYEGVPQNILIFLSFGMQVLKPKSMILTFPLESSITFSSLISLCATHLLWQYWSALMT